MPFTPLSSCSYSSSILYFVCEKIFIKALLKTYWLILLESYGSRSFARYLANTFWNTKSKSNENKMMLFSVRIVEFSKRNHISLICLYLYKDWNLLCLKNTLILTEGSCYGMKSIAERKATTSSGKYFVGRWNQ